MEQGNKAATLAMTPAQYGEAKAAFLARAEALRKGKVLPIESDAPQTPTAPALSDAPADGPVSTSSTSRAPAPYLQDGRSVRELDEAEYQSRRADYVKRSK